MFHQSLRARSLLVVVLGGLALITSPKRAQATPRFGCGQCITWDICLVFAQEFCYQSCGGVGAQGASCVEDDDHCGTQFALLDCGDPE
jgi:hypothetical protein